MNERNFIEIENGDLINLSLIDRVVLRHGAHQQVALLYQGGLLMAESSVAYRYFAHPDNAKRVVVSSAEIHAAWEELHQPKGEAA